MKEYITHCRGKSDGRFHGVMESRHADTFVDAVSLAVLSYAKKVVSSKVYVTVYCEGTWTELVVGVRYEPEIASWDEVEAE